MRKGGGQTSSARLGLPGNLAPLALYSLSYIQRLFQAPLERKSDWN